MKMFKMSRRRKQNIEGAMIIAIIAIALAIIGWALPITSKQSGTQLILIPAGFDFGQSAITFPTPFSSTPTITLTSMGNPSQAFFDTMITIFSALTTWNAMPLPQTEILGLTENRMILQPFNYVNARLVVNVVTAGSAGSALRLQFSINQVNWFDVCGSAGDVLIDTVGLQSGTFCGLPAGFTTDAYYRLTGLGGNGVANPQWDLMYIEWQSEVTVYSAIAQSITTTGFTLTIFAATITNVVTAYNVSWQAEVP